MPNVSVERDQIRLAPSPTFGLMVAFMAFIPFGFVLSGVFSDGRVNAAVFAAGGMALLGAGIGYAKCSRRLNSIVLRVDGIEVRSMGLSTAANSVGGRLSTLLDDEGSSVRVRYRQPGSRSRSLWLHSILFGPSDRLSKLLQSSQIAALRGHWTDFVESQRGVWV